MTAIFGRAPSFPVEPFDVVGVARSCGAEAARIQRPEQIPEAILSAPADRPLVLDIRIEGGLGLPTNKRFQQITRNTGGTPN
jgi:thiamine pyrophosphate-dependent acetolactate synthase large subunit-like protein